MRINIYAMGGVLGKINIDNPVHKALKPKNIPVRLLNTPPENASVPS
ncbi:MAG: hypothetical protein JW874_08550 [Spirochaetales bacterium]|nr:hypothetical protein [Spirochaetales bacterium]